MVDTGEVRRLDLVAAGSPAQMPTVRVYVVFLVLAAVVGVVKVRCAGLEWSTSTRFLVKWMALLIFWSENECRSELVEAVDSMSDTQPGYWQQSRPRCERGGTFEGTTFRL